MFLRSSFLLLPALAAIFLAMPAATAYAQQPSNAQAAAEQVVSADEGQQEGGDSATQPADSPTTDTTQGVDLNPLESVERSVQNLSNDSAALSIIYTVFFEWGMTLDGTKVNLAKLLLALDVAGIPITVFAFLGGAAAIAVGFGAQEMLANFISGLILMVEKPIRAGDLIEYDGERGKVEEIGPRCTRIRKPGNVDLLVPNKKLIENKLINWTLTDDQVRTEIYVGIAYGSPTREAGKIIYDVVVKHERVDSIPDPIVIFEEFGDNSLNFRCLFWVRVNNFLDQLKIQSDIRYEIDDRFREADITIAFPQRDVHLDSLSPVEVRLVDQKPRES